MAKAFLQIGAIAAIGVMLIANVSEVRGQALNGTLKKIKDSGVIVLGVRESSIPFSYLDNRLNRK